MLRDIITNADVKENYFDLYTKGGKVAIANYGLPDRLIPHGSREDMMKDAGMTEQALKMFISKKFEVGIMEEHPSRQKVAEIKFWSFKKKSKRTKFVNF